MSEYTTEEALAFIEAMRLAINGKVGFKWHVQRLSQLADFIESLAAENDDLRARLELAGGLAGEADSADTDQGVSDAVERGVMG